jgi:hypothetical protein
MFTNRLNGKFEPDERTRAPDFWMVRVASACFFVGRDAARHISSQLRSVWPRPWVRFRDLSGSMIHVRRRDIIQLVEASAAQRENDRRLQRLLEAECRENDSGTGY